MTDIGRNGTRTIQIWCDGTGGKKTHRRMVKICLLEEGINDPGNWYEAGTLTHEGQRVIDQYVSDPDDPTDFGPDLDGLRSPSVFEYLDKADSHILPGAQTISDLPPSTLPGVGGPTRSRAKFNAACPLCGDRLSRRAQELFPALTAWVNADTTIPLTFAILRATVERQQKR